MKKFALSFTVVMTFALLFVVSSAFAQGTTQVQTTVRAWSGQNMHSNYQNNTNSCGSCHRIHSGSSDTYMLWDGHDGTAFCESCHDGSTTAPDTMSHALNAGTFSSADADGSMHNVDGLQAMSAAPGGDADGTGLWAQSLECESCHAPHSTDSFALLNMNINKDVDFSKAPLTGATIKAYDAKPTSQAAGEKFVFVKKTLTAGEVIANNGGYGKYAGTLNGGDVVYEPYIWVSAISSKVNATTPTASAAGYIRVPAVFKQADRTAGVPTSGTLAADGFVYGGTIANGTPVFTTAVTAEMTMGAYKVKAGDTAYGTVGTGAGETPVGTVVNGSIWNVKDTNYAVGSGSAFSLFCAQCHTDYLSSGFSNWSGYTYSGADKNLATGGNGMHRHNTIQDRLSCARCHFSHGTDSTIMKNGDQTALAGGQSIVDGTADSAIKRFVGFSVCLQCHTPGNVKLADTTVNAPF